MSSKDGHVIWITGYSGAGKTTLARSLMPHLPQGSVLLDGDDLRRALIMASGGYDYDSRKKLGLTYGRLAGLLARQGMTVVVATISLFHDVHAWNRENIPGYVEVFLDVPEEVRRSRDPKGLYAANAKGKGGQLAGSGVRAEIPLNPDVVLDYPHCLQLDYSVNKILSYMQ